jgi:hypothetical protein
MESRDWGEDARGVETRAEDRPDIKEKMRGQITRLFSSESVMVTPLASHVFTVMVGQDSRSEPRRNYPILTLIWPNLIPSPLVVL